MRLTVSTCLCLLVLRLATGVLYQLACADLGGPDPQRFNEPWPLTVRNHVGGRAPAGAADLLPREARHEPPRPDPWVSECRPVCRVPPIRGRSRPRARGDNGTASSTAASRAGVAGFLGHLLGALWVVGPLGVP